MQLQYFMRMYSYWSRFSCKATSISSIHSLSNEWIL